MSDNQWLGAVPDSTVLWRYVTFTKFVALLEDRALHFASLSSLAAIDPFEGSFTTSAKAALDEQVWSGSGGGLENANAFLAMAGISCWNAAPDESDALWGLYASRDAGVAIQTTAGRLRSAFAKSGNQPDEDRTEIQLGPVDYVDYATATWPEDNRFWPLFHKRQAFRHEHEVRLIVAGPSRQSFNDAQRKAQAEQPDKKNVVAAVPSGPASASRPIAVDLNTLVAQVRISPLAPAWFAELVKKTSARYELSALPSQSILAAPPIK